MTLETAVAALGRCELRRGEAARLEIGAEPGRVWISAIGARTCIAYARRGGSPAELGRLLAEIVAEVEGWRPPAGGGA